MTPAPKRPDDPLSREVDAALEGVDLQEIDLETRSQKKRSGSLLRGAVVGISGDDVIVELGPRMQGVLSRGEFGEAGPVVGKSHEFSLRGQEADGLWRLSLSEARALAAWDDLEVGAHVEARVSGVNTGGLELKIGPLSAFCPASHVALERVEDLSKELGRKLVVEVLEIDREKRRVLASRRAVLQKERDAARQESIGSLAVGHVVNGKVKRVEPFGAFVEVAPGLEGLLHVSNVSHQRVQDPREVLAKDQDVRVKILSIEEGGRRIGLGMKQLEPDPWGEASARFGEGQLVSGRIVRLMDFGAFVELAPGVEGLIHVSQVQAGRVRRLSDVLSAGQEVSVRILSVDPTTKRIALSRLDERGALIGSEDSVEGAEIDRVLRGSEQKAATNLGNLFKKALSNKKPQ